MKRPTLIVLGFGAGLAALMVGALMLHVPGADDVGSPLRTNIFVGLVAAGLVVYFAAVRFTLRNRLPAGAVWIVLGVALAMRAAILPAPPFLSSDIYRYVWDGQVQAAGINPYRYIPADPALEKLRDPDIFPLINRSSYAPTIYPPVAQLVFAAVGQVTGSVIGMKLTMVGFEVVAMVCMLRVLALAGLPGERLLIYAWNPLPLWSFALDGHVDAVAIGLLGLALLARSRHRTGLAGALLAGAALVKFIPVVVASAFVRGGQFWRPVAAGVAVVAMLYALYISAGSHVLGFLPTYGTEEGLVDGTGFWLLAGLAHFGTLPAGAAVLYATAVIVGFAGLALWIATRRGFALGGDIVRLCRDTAILAGCAMAAISPHYPWYFAWLALPCIVAPMPAVIWLSAAPVVLLLDPFHDRFLWPSLVYVPAAGLALAAAWRHRRPSTAAVAASEGTL